MDPPGPVIRTVTVPFAGVFSCTVTVSTPDHAACHKELGERGIVCDFRPDPFGGIRLGPHFFNTEDEVNHAVSELATIVATGVYERHAGAPSLF